MIKFKCFQTYLSKSITLSKIYATHGNIISKYKFSTEKEDNKNIKDETSGNAEPKWMKFFSTSDMMKVDIERAIKSENIDLLNNYVKNNYMTFEYEQLVMVLEKLLIASSAPRLIQEIKLRILQNKHKENPKILLLLLRCFKETQDKFNKKYILVALCKHFENFSHSDQTEVLNFMIDNNYIKLDLLESYLKFYENKFQSLQEFVNFYEGLEDQILIQYMNLYRKLYRIMKPEEFNNIFSRKLLDFLYTRVLIHYHSFEM